MRHYLSLLLTLCMLQSFAQTSVQTVMIDGVNMQYKYFGTGNITVVFEAGMGEGMENWGDLPDRVAKFAKVLCYNRPGINGSDLSAQLPTVPNMANRLDQLIQQVCGSDSILLVAHSMGGYIARYLSNKHPRNIMAVVLLDPSSEEVYRKMSTKEMQHFVSVGDSLFAKQSPAAKAEWKHYLTNYEFMSGIKVPKKIQVYIYSSTELNFYKDQHLQLNKNPWSQHFLVKGDHWFYKKNPKPVIDLLDQVVDKLRISQ